MTTNDGDEQYLTRREAELLIESMTTASEARADAHQRLHDESEKALDKALGAVLIETRAHLGTHDKSHDTHEEKHKSEGRAVETALAAVARERTIHAEAHEREHASHHREHSLNELAISKAETASDLRFKAANEFRATMQDLVGRMATREALAGHVSFFDKRLDELRLSITAIEKGDVQQEGKSRGQGMVIAAIVGTVSFAGAALAIVILLANYATTS